MGEECEFCKIIETGKSKVLYEDSKTIAFLDHAPVVEGHSLVIPKKHWENIEDIPDDELIAVFRAIRKVGLAIMKVVNSEGYLASINNYSQEIWHAHWHIIPRWEGDMIDKQEKIEVSESRMKEIEERVKGLVKA